MQEFADATETVHDRFRLMYEEPLPVIYGFLLLRVGGNRALAEDLTADAYSAAVELFAKGRASEVTISWLRTVARRRLIDHWRRLSPDSIALWQLRVSQFVEALRGRS